jgi:non-specific serine/threonine protein kinase
VLRLKTFGGLSLESERGPLAGAAAQRRRLSVLAVLAASGPGGMTRDKLIGLLWPEVDEARARAALSQSLYALKRDAHEDLVIGHESLTVNRQALAADVVEFEEAIARDDWLTATTRYGGPFLDGVFLSDAPDFEHWLDGVRLRLGQAAERALERVAQDAEARGNQNVAADAWRRLLALDPAKARAVLGVMKALAASADRAGALREAERHARHMRDELESEPSAAVTEYASALRLEMEDGLVASDTPRSRLPLIADEMIGRDAELSAALSLLDRTDVSVLTLTGAGGTGKTRLAIQLARDLEPRVDRMWFVDLSSLREPAGVIPAIAAATGVHHEAGRDPIDAIAIAYADRKVLLVLDNFEQVVAAAPAIARLVGAVPTLKVLVTSRARLDIRAEHEFFVAPLSLPSEGASAGALRDNPAVQLFVRRALAANDAMRFDDDTLAAAARICARVDGLPLAIELAAARCRLMSPRTIAARLESGFELVSGGGRDLPARQQTIRETVVWSVALLDAAERAVFGRMAIFCGGCTLPAAEWICAHDRGEGALDDVSALVDASLLMRDLPANGGEPRLRMLATVREVALETLAGSADADRVAERHAEWYVRMAASLAPHLTGESQRDALSSLACEHANVAGSLEWMIARDDAEGALTLGASVWRYWLVRGHLVEGREWLARVLALSSASATQLEPVRADVMTGAAHLAQNSGAVGEAEGHFKAVLEIRRRMGDEAGIARALADLGWIAWRRCNFPEARRLSCECLALAERLGATRVAALALTNLGATALFEGSFQEACDAFGRSSSLRAQVADRRGVAFANTFWAWAKCRAGAFEPALELLERAEETLGTLGDHRLVYFVRDTKAETYLRLGDAPKAAAILEIDSMKGVRRFGDRWSVAHGLAVASWASRLLGRIDRATTFANESLVLRRAEGDRYGEAECLALLATAARANGDEAGALALFQESRAIRVEIGDAAGIAECDAALSIVETLA